jgi:hypothetical protein
MVRGAERRKEAHYRDARKAGARPAMALLA